MVSTKDKALKCTHCHGKDGRMNWTELGYTADPMEAKKADIRAKMSH
jgi:hypothetical protein